MVVRAFLLLARYRGRDSPHQNGTDYWVKYGIFEWCMISYSFHRVYTCFVRLLMVSDKTKNHIFFTFKRHFTLCKLHLRFSSNTHVLVRQTGPSSQLNGLNLSYSREWTNTMYPVSTRRRFDVVTTLFGRQQRCYNVETTSCAITGLG